MTGGINAETHDLRFIYPYRCDTCQTCFWISPDRIDSMGGASYFKTLITSGRDISKTGAKG